MVMPSRDAYGGDELEDSDCLHDCVQSAHVVSSYFAPRCLFEGGVYFTQRLQVRRLFEGGVYLRAASIRGNIILLLPSHLHNQTVLLVQCNRAKKQNF